MAKIEYSRLICKRTDVPGVVPTVPAVDDITTFVDTDIFIGEFFLNTADSILYTRDDSGIVTITTTASSYLPLAGGTMDSNAIIEGTDSLEINVDEPIGNTTDTFMLSPLTGTGLISKDNDNSDETGLIIGPAGGGLFSTDGTTQSSYNVYKDGRIIRIASQYDRVDIYPTIISGSLTQMTREVIQGFSVETTGDTPTNAGTVSVLSGGGVKTTGDTPTNAGTVSVLSGGGIHVVNVTVVGKLSGGGKYLGAEMRGVFYYDGGTVTLIGSVDKWIQDTFTTATVDLITDGTDIIVQVTGETGRTINWTVTIKSN